MSRFMLGIVSSLAATALTVLAGWIASKRMRHWPVVLLSKLTGLGIWRSYARQSLANLDLGADLADARWVKVMAGRGNELTRDSFQAVWDEADSRLESVQILLPNPESGANSYLTHRESEIQKYDSGYRPGLLAEQVRSNIEYISTISRKRAHVALRLYNLPNICRLIITDQVAYVTTYPASDHGRNAPCVVCRHPGPMYEFASRMFSVAWSQAVPADQHAGETL
jgi:hypothetical protein